MPLGQEEFAHLWREFRAVLQNYDDSLLVAEEIVRQVGVDTAAIVDCMEYRLTSLHEQVRTVLVRLFQEKEMTLDPIKHSAVVLFSFDGFAVTASVQWPDLERNLFAAFVRLLLSRPTPFSRCRQCGSFFARVGRQVYCGTRCRSKANETKRAGTRRDYMRKLMRRRRELAKARRQAASRQSAKRAE